MFHHGGGLRVAPIFSKKGDEMNIRGRERQFLLTVRGRDEIAALCPESDISKIWDVLRTSGKTDVMRKMMLIMNRDHEDHEHYHNSGYQVDYLTDEDLQMLTMTEFRELDTEVSNAFLKGMEVSVDVEEKKGKKTGKSNKES